MIRPAFALSFLVLVLALSCKKKDPGQEEGTGTGTPPPQSTGALNSIITRTSGNNPLLIDTLKMTYDVNNRLDSTYHYAWVASGSGSGYLLLLEGKIQRSSRGVITRVGMSAVTSNPQTLKYERYADGQFAYSGDRIVSLTGPYHRFEYAYDAAGNLALVKEYTAGPGGMELVNTTTFTADDKANPLLMGNDGIVVGTILDKSYWRFVGPNNCTSATGTNPSMSLVNFSGAFTYSAANHPATGQVEIRVMNALAPASSTFHY